MSTAAAKIVDLASYRREREMATKIVAPQQAMPVVYVPVWTYVPVLLVPGYR
jgi:hypothetical protein